MHFLNSISTFIPRVSCISQTVRSLVTYGQQGPKSLLTTNTTHQSNIVASVKPNNVWSLDTVRTVIRNNFPYPRESKRIKAHGFKKRMSTRGGRAVIMRRILKGRHVLSH